MSLSVQLPDSLEKQLTIYCQQHQLPKNETIRLALERLLTDVATLNRTLFYKNHEKSRESLYDKPNQNTQPNSKKAW